MAKYKFPGVYIEEAAVFQKVGNLPTVAIFIGYTEKHSDQMGKDIRKIPITVSNMTEFQNCFGGAQPEKNIEITDESDAFAAKISVGFQGARSVHNLHNAVKLFFAQGAGSCKIVSVGEFKSIGKKLSVRELLSGLDNLTEEKGNLLISVPESQNLPRSDFYLLQENLLVFCQQHLAFAVLDAPETEAQNFRSAIEAYRSQLQSPFLSSGAVFCPNVVTTYNFLADEQTLKIKKNNRKFLLSSIKKSEPARYAKYKSALQNFFVPLPPSPAVAGALLRTEGDRGIWKAVANIALNDVLRPEITINNNEQDFLNIDGISGKSINPIRLFSGKGNLIWGSRTLAGNDPEWRYIPMRRFANKVEKEISATLKKFYQTENSAALWTQIRSLAENYLMVYFRNGAFPGRKPEEAFFVKCGLGHTMTPNDIANGILIVEIGLAPTRPAEFVVLRFSQKVN